MTHKGNANNLLLHRPVTLVLFCMEWSSTNLPRECCRD